MTTNDRPFRVPHDPDDTLLAPGFTVRDYKKARGTQPPERKAIASAVRARFMERYVEPIRAKESGFAMMAISCLMIEALESFIQGWSSSAGRSEKAFGLFFDRFDAFSAFREHKSDFYRHVRCGILHQAETTGGWRIRRGKAPLLDSEGRTVNAKLFLDALVSVLESICGELKTASMDEGLWQNVLLKMDALVENTRPVP